ncbi:hypothetical protein [Methylorubrum extorquens]
MISVVLARAVLADDEQDLAGPDRQVERSEGEGGLVAGCREAVADAAQGDLADAAAGLRRHGGEKAGFRLRPLFRKLGDAPVGHLGLSDHRHEVDELADRRLNVEQHEHEAGKFGAADAGQNLVGDETGEQQKVGRLAQHRQRLLDDGDPRHQMAPLLDAGVEGDVAEVEPAFAADAQLLRRLGQGEVVLLGRLAVLADLLEGSEHVPAQGVRAEALEDQDRRRHRREGG